MAEAPDVIQNEGNGDDLNDEQHGKLVQYQEVTGAEDLEAAKSKLIAYNWNLELAVQAAFNESEGIAAQYHEIHNNHDDFERTAPQHTQQLAGQRHVTAATALNSLVDHRRMSWTQWLIGLILVPYRFTFHTLTDIFTYIIRLVWPSFGRGSGDPIEDVLNFKRNFEERFGLEHPTFYQGTYSQALSDARKELRFLLVYLHSNSHQDTSMFCTDVLCNPGFKEYVNGNMLFWGCDVNTYEGHRVSRAVRESTYPFLAVISLRDNRMTIVWRIEGFMPVDQLIALLARVINENEPALVAARAEREERNMSQTLRQEQDRAYQLALEEDREKARRKKAIEDAKLKEENERRDRELEKQRKVEDIAQQKADCRKRLEQLPEPTSGETNVIQIRIKLPNGAAHCRRFSTTDQFQLLVDFVFSHDDTPSKYALNSNFPRKTFHPDTDTHLSLSDIGINSSSILFVQDLTEESSDED